MVSDYVYDRRADVENGMDKYKAKDFYNYVTEEAEIFGMTTLTNLASALDGGTEEDVQTAIIAYFKASVASDGGVWCPDTNPYQSRLIGFIKAVKWLEDAPGNMHKN